MVTESINEAGFLVAMSVCGSTGRLRELARVSSGGRSACYITLAKNLKSIFVVNYWDSTMVSYKLDDHGLFLSETAARTVIPGQHASAARTAHGDDPHSITKGFFLESFENSNAV